MHGATCTMGPASRSRSCALLVAVSSPVSERIVAVSHPPLPVPKLTCLAYTRTWGHKNKSTLHMHLRCTQSTPAPHSYISWTQAIRPGAAAPRMSIFTVQSSPSLEAHKPDKYKRKISEVQGPEINAVSFAVLPLRAILFRVGCQLSAQLALANIVAAELVSEEIECWPPVDGREGEGERSEVAGVGGMLCRRDTTSIRSWMLCYQLILILIDMKRRFWN